MKHLLNTGSIKQNIITFTAVFIGLYLLSFLIDASYAKLLTNIGKSYYEKNINNDKSLNRKVELSVDQNKKTLLEANITYFDKRDEQGNFIVKTIGTNLRREALISVIFFTSLVFSFPAGFRKNIFKFIIGISFIQLIIFFKLYIFIFDNYNYPEFALKELPAITSFFVYYGSYFFNVTGASTNVIAPVIIWFLLNIRANRN